ncbi:MAG: TIGR02757 family protein, partial [Bacteroidetes bacterium]|nr:TIGR02757 family protein [Bacteroidota bacterium]
TPAFIGSDPVSIPHLFTSKEDIEISAFLTAMISWGFRKSILQNARALVEMMDMDPYGFIRSFNSSDLKPFRKFVHRTFNGEDCVFFLHSLQNIYSEYGGLESCFVPGDYPGVKPRISAFRRLFLALPHPQRHEKHIANPGKGASCKRINMFLRWMVRDDKRGVDFGLWKSIRPSELICPLDVHTGNVARKLGLLQRKSNDWDAAEELTAALRKLDPADPVKFDFALFGLGVFEKF